MATKFLSFLIGSIFSLFIFSQPVKALVLAEQTRGYTDLLAVWQVIQELGDNLSGTAGKFTFRVSTVQPHNMQFDYTYGNSRIYDKTTNTIVAPYACFPPGSSPDDRLRGLTFNTNGVPPGFEDVTLDFSCHNYSFIPGHKYLILISNANMSNDLAGKIWFGAVSYGSNPILDYFTGGGLRYANGNKFDIYHNSGGCGPLRYIWNDPTVGPVSGCNIWTLENPNPKNDLYFIFKDTTPEPPPLPSKTPLILIPGIGGSELKVADTTLWNAPDGHGGNYNHAYSQGEKVWVNEGEAAQPGDDDYFDVLRMKTDGLNSEANLGLTGNLYSGAYGSAINFFTQNGYTPGQDFFVFPYDWRKDISTTKTELDNKINQIKTQTGAEKVDIVAHSMGGLVARNYIADAGKASNVRKLFTLGTPHLGSVKYLKYLMYGGCIIYEVGPFCLSIAPSETKDILQNITSGYELLPDQTYYSHYSGQDNQHPYPFADLRDIDINGITGALNYPQLKTLLTNLGHNASLFTPSEAFHNLDSQLANTNGVEVTNIAGSGMSTLGQIIEKYKIDFAGIKIPEKDEFKINGDDTVPLLSSSFGSSTIFYTKQKHGELPSNGPALNLVKNILSGNSQLPTGVSNQPYQFSGTGLSVHSPVNIHVYDANNNHTGPTPNGDFETNIPGSSYDSLDDAKFIFLPQDGQYTIKFEATNQGSFDFKIRKYEDDINTQTTLYNNVPINSTSTGQTILDTNSTTPPTLQIDQQTVNATSTLIGNASYDETPPVTTIQLSGTLGNNNWYKSDVLVSLTATDEINGSGIDKIEYTLDNGQTIQTYTNPFIISQEGIFKLKVKAIDKAGNEENPQEKEIKIDKTPPEALVQFNLTSQNLEINGQEINPGEVILTDEAGNTTKLQIEPKEKKRKEKLEIKTISYNNGPIINLPDNKFEVEFKTDKKSGELKEFEQNIKIKGEEKIQAEYNRKKNITKIEIKENKEKNQKIEKDGIVLLQLKTNKGQLEANF